VRYTAIPVEEYLTTTYEPDREYVDGRLVDRPAGDYFHSRLQGLILALLASREQTHRFRVFPELRVKVSDEPRYRIPDLCVKALPHQITPILLSPELLIEIVSPDDKVQEMLTKIGDYLAAGIPHIWVADPYERTLVAAGQAGIRRVPALKLSTPLVGEVDFFALFEQLRVVFRTPASHMLHPAWRMP
jgi:Uma2 family endonuclease